MRLGHVGVEHPQQLEADEAGLGIGGASATIDAMIPARSAGGKDGFHAASMTENCSNSMDSIAASSSGSSTSVRSATLRSLIPGSRQVVRQDMPPERGHAHGSTNPKLRFPSGERLLAIRPFDHPGHLQHLQNPADIPVQPALGQVVVNLGADELAVNDLAVQFRNHVEVHLGAGLSIKPASQCTTPLSTRVCRSE